MCFSRTDYVGFLLSSLYNEKDIFLIHCDKKGPQDLQSYVQHLNDTYPNIVKLRSRDYSWAGYSHVEISLDTISIALNLPTFWTHFVFLSEQHLPLKSPEGIRDYLKTRKSMAAMRCTVEMLGGEKADIENRLYASYRELPGVGSFAVGPSDRIHAGLASTYHGSNWIVYHRDHCRILAEAEKNGDFHAFLDVVHAEEMAMPSILSPWQHEIESDDPTLVATPNAGNGYSLEMDEELFRSAIGTHYLFIRKRTNTLAPFVLDYIMMNNFVPSIHPAPNQTRTISKLVKMLRPHPTQ